MKLYRMNTKKVTAKQILATIDLNLDYLKNLEQVNDTLEDDLALVEEMLEKTQNLTNPNLIGINRLHEDDLTVDEFDDELENFCKYSMNESIRSDNVYTLDCFREFVYIVDNDMQPMK